MGRGLGHLMVIGSVAGIALALGLGFVATSPAHAGVSPSGAFNPIPSATTLHVGDFIDVTLRLSNTSQTTPPDTFQFLPATLVAGTVATFMACTDSFCSSELPGTLAFVPVGGNGCVSNVANVTSCALDGVDSNQVDVVIGGAGVPLPARCSPPTLMMCLDPTFVDVATIRLQAVAPVSGTGTFDMATFSDFNLGQVTATFNTSTATGDASGSTAFLFQKDPIGDPCTLGTDCQSGFCVDGVCCESACPGPVQSCNAPGSNGRCTLDYKAPAASTFAEGLLAVVLLVTGLWSIRGFVRRDQ